MRATIARPTRTTPAAPMASPSTGFAPGGVDPWRLSGQPLRKAAMQRGSMNAPIDFVRADLSAATKLVAASARKTAPPYRVPVIPAGQRPQPGSHPPDARSPSGSQSLASILKPAALCRSARNLAAHHRACGPVMKRGVQTRRRLFASKALWANQAQNPCLRPSGATRPVAAFTGSPDPFVVLWMNPANNPPGPFKLRAKDKAC